ncbi:MAG: hypothetical protein A2162_06500 [Deltaproteobacteria bacterium RBG_13_52_11b]|nr:MAG: hypothetical protein A2162_06500 [Deltaproteobacteria bacterium RBG_13_52_11b]
MKYKNLMSGMFWLALGVLFSIWSTTYHIGSITQPGPGFLPLILGILIVVFSLIILGQGWKADPAKEKEVSFSLPAGWKKIAYVILVLLFTTFSFEPLGYLITVFLLIALLMLGKEWRSLRKAVLTAFLTALGVYLVFILLLEQPFPRGLLRF